MSTSTRNMRLYYLSTVGQDLIITLGVLVLHFLLGQGILEDETNGNGENGAESVVEFNGYVILYLLVSLVLGSIIFYLIFTKLKKYGIRTIYSIVLGFSFLLFLSELFTVMFDQIDNVVIFSIYALIGLFVTIFGAYFVWIYGTGQPKIFVRNAGVVFSAISIGRLMALYFDLTSIVMFAIILSIYDIYSVFKGPLSKIIGEPTRRSGNEIEPDRDMMEYQFRKICKEGTPVVISYRNSVLGIGDVLFFAILIYRAFLEWQFFGLIFTSITVIMGSIGTLYYLQKMSPLPGLPLPIFFSLIGFGVMEFTL